MARVAKGRFGGTVFTTLVSIPAIPDVPRLGVRWGGTDEVRDGGLLLGRVVGGAVNGRTTAVEAPGVELVGVLWIVPWAVPA